MFTNYTILETLAIFALNQGTVEAGIAISRAPGNQSSLLRALVCSLHLGSTWVNFPHSNFYAFQP
jgi:hypothetical protein